MKLGFMVNVKHSKPLSVLDRNFERPESLYEKAKEIKNQLINVDYSGNPSNVNRLFEITNKLKRAPQVSIIQLPKCHMATSGYNSFQETFRTMFNMINSTEEVKKGLGYHQAGIYVPIKLRGEK